MSKNVAIKDNKLERLGKKWDFVEVNLLSDCKIKKVAIAEDKLLDDDEKAVVEFTLKEDGRKLIMKELHPAKNDYKHDFDRGTVHYTPSNRNYSYHKVIVPDGTTLFECNFTQRTPHTNAIIGKNLIFDHCNLVNVELDPTWTVEGNTCQIKRVLVEQKIVDGRKVLVISNQLEISPGVYTENSRKEDVCRDDIDLENKLRKYEVL